MYNKLKNLILNHSDENFNSFMKNNKILFNFIKLFVVGDFIFKSLFTFGFLVITYDFKFFLLYFFACSILCFGYFFIRDEFINKFNKKISNFFKTEINNSIESMFDDSNSLKLELNRFLKKGEINKNDINDFNDLVLNSELTNKEKRELIKMMEIYSQDKKVLKNIYSFSSSLKLIIEEKEKDKESKLNHIDINDFASLEKEVFNSNHTKN